MAYDLALQKRLSASVLKVGVTRVRFDPARVRDIKAAITKEDIRRLVGEGAIRAIPERGISRARAREGAQQRSKGLRKGLGSRKGTANARTPAKRVWMNRIRAQRAFIKRLKEAGIVTKAGFRELYRKSKGGFFRSVRHIKIYVKEQGLAKEEK